MQLTSDNSSALGSSGCSLMTVMSGHGCATSIEHISLGTFGTLGHQFSAFPDNFKLVEVTLLRYCEQPLRQSSGKTIHRWCQGDMLDKVVVDFTTSRKEAHMHYVGMIRVKSLDGLFILNLCADKISVNGSVRKKCHIYAQIVAHHLLFTCHIYIQIYAIRSVLSMSDHCISTVTACMWRHAFLWNQNLIRWHFRLLSHWYIQLYFVSWYFNPWIQVTPRSGTAFQTANSHVRRTSYSCWG